MSLEGCDCSAAVHSICLHVFDARIHSRIRKQATGGTPSRSKVVCFQDGLVDAALGGLEGPGTLTDGCWRAALERKGDRGGKVGRVNWWEEECEGEVDQGPSACCCGTRHAGKMVDVNDALMGVKNGRRVRQKHKRGMMCGCV